MDEYELKEILKRAGYPYLTAPDGKWIDAEGNEKTFDEMDTAYLENCYNMLKKQEQGIKRGCFFSRIKHEEAQEKDMIKKAKNLYNIKLKELEDYLE